MFFGNRQRRRSYDSYRAPVRRTLIHSGRTLICLNLTNLFISFFLFAVGAVCTGIGWNWLPSDCTWSRTVPTHWTCNDPSPAPNLDTIPNCAGGTPIWQGFLALVVSIIGLFASTRPRSLGCLSCFQTVNLLLSFLLFTLIGIISVYLALYTKYTIPSYGLTSELPSDWKKYFATNIVFDSIIIFLALLLVLVSICISVLLCLNFSALCPGKRYREKLYREGYYPSDQRVFYHAARGSPQPPPPRAVPQNGVIPRPLPIPSPPTPVYAPLPHQPIAMIPQPPQTLPQPQPIFYPMYLPPQQYGLPQTAAVMRPPTSRPIQQLRSSPQTNRRHYINNNYLDSSGQQEAEERSRRRRRQLSMPNGEIRGERRQLNQSLDDDSILLNESFGEQHRSPMRGGRRNLINPQHSPRIPHARLVHQGQRNPYIDPLIFHVHNDE